jgi:uncharacterized tellurite resistance protein B-like protein
MANVITNVWNSIFDHDQHMWDNFSEEQKIAFCKIIQVLVKSDGATQSAELQELPSFSISYFTVSKKISLEDAIISLKAVNESSKLIIIKELNQVANSDDHLSSPEIDLISKITSGIK